MRELSKQVTIGPSTGEGGLVPTSNRPDVANVLNLISPLLRQVNTAEHGCPKL